MSCIACDGLSRPLYLHEYHPVSKLNVESHLLKKPRFPAVDSHGHFADFYCPLYTEGKTWSPPDIPRVIDTLQQSGIRRVVNLDGFWDGFMGLTQRQILDTFRPYDGFFVTFVSVNTERAKQPGFEPYVRQHLTQAREMGAKGVKLFKHVSVMLPQADGSYLPGRNILIDDERLNVIWATAAELGMPVLAHIGDPEAFFDPVDERNERYLELQAHPDWSFYGKTYGFAELMAAQRRLLAGNPDTTFIIPHVGSNAENLAFVSRCLEDYPNMHIDLAARIDELGRQPYTARAFFEQWQDRILLGTDVYTETASWVHGAYYRFLETFDECIPCGNFPAYGIGLPDGILRKIYFENADRLLGER